MQMAAFPFLLLYLLWRGAKDKRYRGSLVERWGKLPPHFSRTGIGAIWLHAVSVGEVLSAAQLIEALREEIPGVAIYVSVGTIGGRDAAAARLKHLVAGVFFAPLDYVMAVRRVLRTLRPSAVVVLETEIWPNMYREAVRSGAKLVIVNGRISAKTLPQYLKLRWFFAPVLALPDAILAQSEQDRSHYLQVGAPEARVRSAGNLKYDFDLAGASPAPELVQFFATVSRPVWIAASTVAPVRAGDVDEDDVVIEAFLRIKANHPNLSLVLAPRKPERFDEVAHKLERAGIGFVRRSALGGRAAVLLLDSVGELARLFPYADVVFMGGTLADRGGHNVLEPAAAGKPIIVGPHLENFAEIASHFHSAGALVEISAANELAPAVELLLSDPARRTALGNKAAEAAAAHRGATVLATRTISEAYHGAIPGWIRRGPLTPVLRGLAWIWRREGERRRAAVVPKRLDTPVISIGGIAIGGAGKTPMVAHLARELGRRGYRPAILTRGYKRRSPERVAILPAGSQAETDVTGDEAQILLRTGVAHLGISADRYAAGQRIEKDLRSDVFLLDDGFQHARLHRDLDIVLIDSLDPFAGGAVVPLGRLREPVEALSRANVVILTRAEREGPRIVRDRLAELNPRAPVFRSYTQPRGWRTFPADQPVSSIDHHNVVAFCGLGNPLAFWTTLESLGLETSLRFAFPDHHRYTFEEVQRIAAQAREVGATALLTTEKDMMNLPSNTAAATEDMPVYWLAIDLKIEGETELMGIVERAISHARSHAMRSEP